MGADEETSGRVAPETGHPASLAQPAVRRQILEVGAVCGKAARTDLCGGRSAMGVPTATEVQPGISLSAGDTAPGFRFAASGLREAKSRSRCRTPPPAWSARR